MINKKDVEYVADLAKLYLNEEEIEMYTKQLDSILEYIEKLDQLDTSNVAPTAHILPMKNVFREDQIEASLEIEDVLKNAPSTEDNCFEVPKVIE